MADEQEFRNWAQARRFRDIAKELIRLERLRLAFDLDTLGDDPVEALDGHDEVTVQYESTLPDGCSVFGFYEYRSSGPSVIHVHRATTFARDNFTILHELGHHVQQLHPEWVDVRHGVRAAIGDTWEEQVADAFAAELLIPEDAFDSGLSTLSARTLSTAHEHSRASRSAVAMRAVDLYSGRDSAAVVVATLQGDVVFARSWGDDVFAPARGLQQPDVVNLAEDAVKNDGYAQRDMTLNAQSGWSQHELKAEASLDYIGEYLFIVIRPRRRFGDKMSWERRNHHCANSACSEVFEVDETMPACPTCRDPKCPMCRECSCQLDYVPVCPMCGLGYSAAEQEDPAQHECF